MNVKYIKLYPLLLVLGLAGDYRGDDIIAPPKDLPAVYWSTLVPRYLELLKKKGILFMGSLEEIPERVCYDY